MHKSALVLAFLGAAFAANITTSLWLPFPAGHNLRASVISAGPTATAYALAVACWPNEPLHYPDDCYFAADFIITEGPSTIHYTNTYNLDPNGNLETATMNCQMTSTSYPSCTYTLPNYLLSPSVHTYDSSASGYYTSTAGPKDLSLLAVTISAGDEGSSASSTSNSPTVTTESSSGSSPPVQTTASSMRTMTSAGGGAAMITQAPWIVGCAVLAYGALR